jgi:lipid-A-disaccharide synthase-like uncharacterized protein
LDSRSLQKEIGKKKLTDIGLWVFSLDTGLFTKTYWTAFKDNVVVFSFGIGFGLIVSINQLLLQKYNGSVGSASAELPFLEPYLQHAYLRKSRLKPS